MILDAYADAFRRLGESLKRADSLMQHCRADHGSTEEYQIAETRKDGSAESDPRRRKFSDRMRRPNGQLRLSFFRAFLIPCFRDWYFPRLPPFRISAIKNSELDLDRLVNKVRQMGRTSDADQRLKDAALSLMWEQSFGAITVDTICQQADVKKGTFYYFFDSKSDLAVAALDDYWKGQKPIWDSQFSPVRAPLDRIRAHCDAVYQQQLATKSKTGRVLGCPFCTLGSEVCKNDELIHAKVCEILDNKLKYWESAIRDAQRDGVAGAGNPVEKTRCAVAYFEGLLAQARLHNDAQSLATLGANVCQHIVACSAKPALTSASAAKKKPSAVAAAETSNEEFDSTKY